MHSAPAIPRTELAKSQRPPYQGRELRNQSSTCGVLKADAQPDREAALLQTNSSEGKWTRKTQEETHRKSKVNEGQQEHKIETTGIKGALERTN